MIKKIDKSSFAAAGLLLLLFVSPFFAVGQQEGAIGKQIERPTIKAEFTEDTILIGDQIYLQVTVTKDVAQAVALPEVTSEATENKIEVLGLPELDTLKVDGREVTLRARYKVTSFDKGVYTIKSMPMLYVDKNINDTIYSDSLVLVVDSYVIDTATYVMADLKPLVSEPFTFDELKYYVAEVFSSVYTYIGLLLAVLIIVALWYIRRRRLMKKENKVIEPPHIVAIRKLIDIENRKMWQNGFIKEYYTEITDALRIYLNGRYGVNAMEMTSIEIFEALEGAEIPSREFEKLRELLVLSDYVKFAKISPSQDENIESYRKAFYFVEETKIIVLEVENDTEKEGE